MSLQRLRKSFAERPHHLIPFFVLGDPDPDTSVELVVAAVEAGATQVELGIPFSDPVADGPAVQAAGERALASGATVERSLELLAAIRSRVDVPLNLLVYGNLVHARGYQRFAHDVVAAGASSLLVPDIPFEECGPLREACAQAELGLVHFLAPSTPTDRAELLAQDATGFLYLAGLQGVTGASSGSSLEAVERISDAVSTPLVVGFGIRTPRNVRTVLGAGASAAVVGSALARRIELGLRHGSPSAALIADVRNRVRRLATSTRPLQTLS